MDEVRMDIFKSLVEIEIASGEYRHLLNGEESFTNASGILRIAAGGSAAERQAFADGLHKDSTLQLEFPDVDIDGDTVFSLTLRFYTGPNVLVLIECAEAMPRKAVDYVLDAVGTALLSTKLDEGRYLKLAEKVENIGLYVLEARTREIEQSVRDALGDEHFSEQDDAALRSYPERLARVEKAAARLGERPREARSAEPPARYPGLGPIAADFFGKWVEDAAEDAREAVARLSGLISSQQIVLSQRQAMETARFQRVVTIVGAAVLVPGLVAAIFGANVGFRGRESTEAFWAMLLLMAGSGIGSYVLMRVIESGLARRARRFAPIAWLADLSEQVRLALGAVLALLLVAIGLGLLADSSSPQEPNRGEGGHRAPLQPMAPRPVRSFQP